MGNLSTASENAGPSQTSAEKNGSPRVPSNVLHVVLETTVVNFVGEFACHRQPECYPCCRFTLLPMFPAAQWLPISKKLETHPSDIKQVYVAEEVSATDGSAAAARFEECRSLLEP